MRVASFRKQRGVSAVLVGLILAVLVGFGALALDIGYLFVSRGKLQNAADAAALAGANTIGRAAGGAFPPTGANLTIVNTAVANSLADHGLTAVTPTVNWWDSIDPSVSKRWAAVKVDLTRTEPLFFAEVLGISSKTVGVSSTAVVGPPVSARTLPFAVSYCAIIKGWNVATGAPITSNGANQFAFGDPPDSEKGNCTGTVSGTITGNNTFKVAASEPDVVLLTIGSKIKTGSDERVIEAVLSCSPPSGDCTYRVSPNGNVTPARTFGINNGPIGNWTPLRYETSGAGGTNEIRQMIPGQGGTSPLIAIGDEIRVRTGVVADLYSSIAACSCATASYNSSTTIECPAAPSCLKITVPVVNGVPCSDGGAEHKCPALSGTNPLDGTPLSPLGATDGNNRPIVGFACLQIRQVRSSGGNMFFAGTLEAGCVTSGAPGGGAYYGVAAYPLLGR